MRRLFAYVLAAALLYALTLKGPALAEVASSPGGVPPPSASKAG